MLASQQGNNKQFRHLLSDSPCSRKRLRPKAALPACYKNRPETIRRAIYKVWEIAPDAGLSRSTVTVLQAILALGVSINDPLQPLFARKLTLARQAKCSEVTVYRALKQLEGLGWIRRVEQPRLCDGSMDIGRLHITETLATLLELLVGNNEKEKTTAGQGGLADSKQIPGNLRPRPAEPIGVDGVMRQEPLKMKAGLTGGPLNRGEQEVDLKASVNNQSTQGGFVRYEGRAVARELLWLITENRLSFGQLFKLQTLARQVPGQRLSDFVALREQRIATLKSTNDCFRYLKKLIDEQLDARYLCAQQKRAVQARERHQARMLAAERRAAWGRAHHERLLTDAAGCLTYRVNGLHGLLDVSGEGGQWLRTEKINQAFIRAVQEGKLVAAQGKHRQTSPAEAMARLQQLRKEQPWLGRREVLTPS